MLMGLQYIGS